MTCIVGVETDNGVIIGGDSAATGGSSLSLRTDTKVFRAGPYIMGFTTSYRMGQILRYRLNPQAPDSWDVDRFMATTFVDRVRECLRDHGWMGQDEHRDQGGTFLVGVGDRLYSVHGDFQIGRAACRYDAVGSGAELAKGALYASATTTLSPRERVEQALGAAATHNAAVSAPFVVEELADA